MTYDAVIIGGGLSGLCCGIECLNQGLSVAMLSGGMNALHFSSGSIDLFGFDANQQPITRPFDHIRALLATNTNHPYTRCGMDAIIQSLTAFQEAIAHTIELSASGDKNHIRLTAFGIERPTYLSPASVHSGPIDRAMTGDGGIALLNFRGFRDFSPELMLAQLKKNPHFLSREIMVNAIEPPDDHRMRKNPADFRSIDIARLFDSERHLQNIARQITIKTAGATLAILPAFMGIERFTPVYQRLSELTGIALYEVSTLPPSIMGMRIDQALKSRFSALGGVFIAGEKAVAGTISQGRLHGIFTDHQGNHSVQGKTYAIATGSFFSGGLASTGTRISEPIFNLKVNGSKLREHWHATSFLNPGSHPFLEYGIFTDANLNPFDENGDTITNLFCCGSCLADYNPIREASGGGVAIATGYTAAKKIIEKLVHG